MRKRNRRGNERMLLIELRYHGQIQPRTWNLCVQWNFSYKGHLGLSYLRDGFVLKSNLGHNECPY